MCYSAVAAPTDPQATVNDLDSITFTWQSIYTADNGAAYRVSCVPDCSPVDDTAETKVTITGLMSATEYTLSVVTIINGISSEPSGEVTATISELYFSCIHLMNTDE